MAQGKAWDKEKIIELLEPKLKLGYSVTKACKLLGVAQSTVQTWIDDDDELRLKVNSWMNEISDMARRNWSEAIKNGIATKFGNDTYNPSKDWLDRKEKEEFSTRTEQTGADGEPLTVKIIEDTSLNKPTKD